MFFIVFFEDEIVIEGRNEKSVQKACGMLDKMLAKRVNCFLAVQIENEEIVRNVRRVYGHVCCVLFDWLYNS